MNIDGLYFANKASFEEVIKHGLENIEDGDGFEYIVGKIKEGTFKVIFEPECSHSAVVIDGVGGFGYTLIGSSK